MERKTKPRAGEGRELAGVQADAGGQPVVWGWDLPLCGR